MTSISFALFNEMMSVPCMLVLPTRQQLHLSFCTMGSDMRSTSAWLHSVTAPRDGMVAGLQLRVGSRVEDGQVLLQVAVQQGVAGEASACGAAKAATVDYNTAAAAV